MQGTPAPAAGATIFLAETTSDLTDERDQVRRELQQSHHVILPNQSLPTNKPQLETLVRDCLQRSRLSVHLIGEHYGFVPEDEPERSAIWLQQDLACERGDNAEFSRLIWLPPGLEPKDERQRKFIEMLRNGFHSTNGSDLIQTKIEDLKTIIQEKLNPKPKLAATSKPDNGQPDNGLKQVYLVCDQCDLEKTEPLYNYLSQPGRKVLLPEFDEKALQAHKQNLLDCDAVLFYFDEAPEMWLQAQLKRLMSYRPTTQPLAAVGVYMTGEETFKKKIYKTPEAMVMKNFGAFDAAVLQRFMEQLSQPQRGAQ